jgi:hypothetical protein
MNGWVKGGLAVAVTALAAAGGFWQLGAQRLAGALDAQVATLAAQGLRVSHDSRTIGGFPTGYEVSFSGLSVEAADRAWRFEAPAASGRAALIEPGRIALTLPQGGRFAVAAAPGQQALDFAVASEGLSFDLSPALGGVAARGARLSFDHAAPAGLRVARATLDEFSGRYHTEPDGTARFALDAVRAALAYDVDGVDGPVLLDTEARGLAIDVGLSQPIDPAGLLASGGSGAVTFETASATGSGASTLPDGRTVEYRGEAGPSRNRIALADGRLDYELAAGSAFWRFTGGPLAAGEEAGFGFDSATLAVSAPLAPAPAPERATLRLDLAGLSANEAVWARFDPSGSTPRAPLTARLDLGADVAWLTTLANAAEFGGPPLTVLSVDVAEARVAGLGADARLTGAAALEPVPKGAFDLVVTGWATALAALERAGVVSFDDARMAEGLVQLYGADPADPGAIRSRIEIDGPAVTANGVPVR